MLHLTCSKLTLFYIAGEQWNSGLKQPLILPFLCHKSATTCQIDSYKVSNSKLKPDLCNCVKIEIIEFTTPPQ